MNKETKQRLINEFTKHSTAMVDVEHIAQTLLEGMDTDIQTGDIVISTNYYDGGMFIVPELKKPRRRQETKTNAQGNKETDVWWEDVVVPNPYEENVKDNDPNSRLASLSVRTKKDDPDARKEKRVKVRKLCLFRWDEETNSYPTISGDIIFRQKLMSFADEHRFELNYYRTIVDMRERNEEIYGGERLVEARKHLELLERLVSIPPFQCFYDEKYGFLVKRKIRMNRIVCAENWTNTPFVSKSIHSLINDEVKQEVKNFKEHLETRESKDVEFKEDIVRTTFRPDRIEKILEKHGQDGLEKTFDPISTGIGKKK